MKIEATKKSEPAKVLFKFNSTNHYTHLDVELAKELGFTCTLLKGKNYMMYSGTSRMPGKELFGTYIQTLFKLKKQKLGGKYTKQLLNEEIGV